MLKLFLSLSLVLTAKSLWAQEVNFSASAGPVVPIGKDLSRPYSLGLGISAGVLIDFREAFILPEAQFKMFAANHLGAVRDNLLLYGTSVYLGHRFRINNLTISPAAGIGYNLGSNFLTDRDHDFTGGYFGDKKSLVTLAGVFYQGGIFVSITSKLGVAIQYQLNRSNASLTSEAMQSFPYLNVGSQLYGKVASFPAQKMSLDNLSFQFCMTL